VRRPLGPPVGLRHGAVSYDCETDVRDRAAQLLDVSRPALAEALVSTAFPNSQLPVFPDPYERCVDANRSRRSDCVSIASSCRPTRCGSAGTPICNPLLAR
jgi:hypothetical protein